MKKILITVIMFISAAAVFSQTAPVSFEKKFAEFRYSLYPELERMPLEQIAGLSFKSTDQIVIKAAKFLSENHKEIAAYRESVLKKYEGKAPSLDGYRMKEGFEPITSFSDIVPSGSDGMETIINLLTIEPLYSVSFLASTAISKSEEPAALGAFTIKSLIGFPKIICIRNSETKWTVYSDYYSKIFIMGLDAETGKCSLDKYYVKNEPVK